MGGTINQLFPDSTAKRGFAPASSPTQVNHKFEQMGSTELTTPPWNTVTAKAFEVA
jgi:hypothetical protein